MATKDLARTVIEGGRARRNHWERDYSHRQERAALRRYSAQLDATGAAADSLTVETRPHVSKQFHDKLGPAERWLRSHVGDLWDDVLSEAMRRFDPRTLPGRHILYDHLLPRRAYDGGKPEDDFGPKRRGFFVDDEGTLREHPSPTYRRDRKPERLVLTTEAVRQWLGDRRVGRRGTVLFWFHHVGGPDHEWVVCERQWMCRLPTEHRHVAPPAGGPLQGQHRLLGGRYRQGVRLDEADQRRVAQLSPGQARLFLL